MRDTGHVFNLTGKVSLVTGSGRGIGKGIALALARAGADVAVADINKDTADQTYGEIIDLGRKSLSLHIDATNKDEVDLMVRKVVEMFGQIDVGVVNIGNTGRSASRLPSAEDIDIADFRQQIEVYLVGYLY